MGHKGFIYLFIYLFIIVTYRPVPYGGESYPRPHTRTQWASLPSDHAATFAENSTGQNKDKTAISSYVPLNNSLWDKHFRAELGIEPRVFWSEGNEPRCRT